MEEASRAAELTRAHSAEKILRRNVRLGQNGELLLLSRSITASATSTKGISKSPRTLRTHASRIVMSTAPNEAETKLRAAFAKFDLNGDGVLTLF